MQPMSGAVQRQQQQVLCQQHYVVKVFHSVKKIWKTKISDYMADLF